MTDINLGEGTSVLGGNTALGAGIGGFIGSWFGNGFGYGGRNNNATATQDGFDTAMIHDDNTAIQNQLENIGSRLTDNNYRINMNLSNGISSAYTGLTNTLNQNNISNMQGQYAVQSAIANSTANLANGQYNTQSAVNAVGTNLAQDLSAINQNISSQGYESRLATQNLGTEMGTCCCSIKTAVQEEGAKTRELIQNNFIQGLQTALSDAKSKANALETQVAFSESQAAQTQYLLAQLKTSATTTTA